MRFDTSLVAGYGRRCRFNHVQVIVCLPVSPKGRIFPTTFWLTCPHLIHMAGKIESHQGVHELEAYMNEHELNHEWRAYNLAHQAIRLSLLNSHQLSFIRKYHTSTFKHLIKTGIGGIRYRENITVKCLHLQTASYLGLNYHPAQEWLKSKGLNSECESCMCKKI